MTITTKLRLLALPTAQVSAAIRGKFVKKETQESRNSIDKKITIVLWSFSICVVLYFFAISSEAMVRDPNTISWQIRTKHFMNFCILIFGGSFAYHLTTELMKCPYNKTNKKLWGDVQIYLFLIVSGYIATAVLLFLSNLKQDAIGWLLAFFALLYLTIWSVSFFGRLAIPLKELLDSSNQGSQGTAGDRGP